MEINVFFSVMILIASVVVHELAHGYAAYFLGDKTAKYAGRLTINPFKHLELFGSLLVPLLTHLLGGIVFGWAKPVPYNPYNLKAGKWGEVIVAGAGPLSNLLIALVFGLLLRFSFAPAGIIDGPAGVLLSIIVLVNITLLVFNLIPVAPLDGSKIFYNLLPSHFSHWREIIERNSILVFLLFIFILWRFFTPIIPFLFTLITGVRF